MIIKPKDFSDKNLKLMSALLQERRSDNYFDTFSVEFCTKVTEMSMQ